MIAIQTKYLPATNSRGSRIKAFTSTGMSVTVPFSHELSGDRVYFSAVEALVAKYKLAWDISRMRCGEVKNGYVFCFDASVVN